MENRPISPHIQIYKWHISSLVSISHRITGIINFFAITLICIWFALMLLGESNYQIIKIFLETRGSGRIFIHLQQILKIANKKIKIPRLL